MSLYRYEIHSHTCEASKCGYVNARDVVRMHKDAGYQGIVFTDHFNEENFILKKTDSWNDTIDRYLEGYKLGEEEGRRVDMDVLWGLELRFTENDNDFLVYGITEEFLREHTDLHKIGIIKFMALIAGRDDIMIYQAHPFRDGCSLVNPLIVHGLEIYNGNPRHDSRNKQAVSVAMDNHLLFLSGSDFHRTEDIATGGILLPERIRNNRDLIRSLKTLKIENLVTGELLSNDKQDLLHS